MNEGFTKEDIGLDHPITHIAFALLIIAIVYAIYLLSKNYRINKVKKDTKK